MKASCKEPAGRYATAQELADDLARFLDDRPILARRPTVLDATMRWARRHKQIVAHGRDRPGPGPGGRGRRRGIAGEEDPPGPAALHPQSFPAIDTITMTAMQQATESAMGLQSEIDRPGSRWSIRRPSIFYELAAELPPTDLASRTIIARAHYRIGFTHAVMSLAWGKPSESCPALSTGRGESHYRDAIARFEALLAEAPRDVDIRSHFADALGEWGLGWFLSVHERSGGSRAALPSRPSRCDGSWCSIRRSTPSIISEELVKLADLSNTLAANLEASGRGREVERASQRECRCLHGPGGSTHRPARRVRAW